MNSTYLALLNIGRNRRRSVLILLIMTIGTTGLIVNNGLITFIFNGLRDDAIYGRYGHLQVYRQGYTLNHRQAPFDYWFSDAEYSGLQARIQRMAQVKAVTAEATLPVFLSWGDRSAAALAYGVVPADLDLLTAPRIVAGRNQIRDSGTFADAVIGHGLAQRLQLQPGDVLTITASGRNHAFNGLDVRVSGVFEEGFREYDDWILKLPLSALQRLAGQSGVEKILVLLRDTSQTEAVRAAMPAAVQGGPAIETASWRDLAEFYRQVLAMFGKELKVIEWIIQVLVFFAMVTGLAMMFTERQHEMATLIAMGMTRVQLALLFARESAWFGLAASGLGALFGTIAGMLVSWVGINMPPPPGSTRPFVARVDLSAMDIGHYCLLTLVVTCLAAIVPALWIWRLNVAAALRQERS